VRQTHANVPGRPVGGPRLVEVVADRVVFDFGRYNVALDADGVIYVSFDDGIFRLPPETFTEAP